MPLSDVKKQIALNKKNGVTWNKGIKYTPEMKTSINMTGLGKNIDFKKRGKSISKAMMGMKRPEEYKQKRANLMKQKWADPEYRELILNSRKGKMNPWNKGKKCPQHGGENHWHWRGGITPLFASIRQCFEYKQWRTSIFERDNYTCQTCGERGVELNVDHYPKTFAQIISQYNIKSIEEALQCEELWSLENNRTLCVPCHRLTPTWGRQKGVIHAY